MTNETPKEKRPTILLVDDDDNLRMEYKESLKAAGFYVVDIDDGSKLETTLSQIGFDAIISDTDMSLDGDIACRRAIKNKLVPPRVMIVGMSDNIDNRELWEGIAYHFLYKSSFASKQFPSDIGRAVMSYYLEFDKIRNTSSSIS